MDDVPKRPGVNSGHACRQAGRKAGRKAERETGYLLARKIAKTPSRTEQPKPPGAGSAGAAAAAAAAAAVAYCLFCLTLKCVKPRYCGHHIYDAPLSYMCYIVEAQQAVCTLYGIHILLQTLLKKVVILIYQRRE